MVTSLQVNGSSSAASTLAAAGKLFSAVGGGSGNVSTKVAKNGGTSTSFIQIFAKGTTTTQTTVSAIPAPSDSNFNGWMWDVTTLEGQRIAAGTWTPAFHLLASGGGTITPTVAWYKRSSGGSYTSIGSVAGSSLVLSASAQALTFTPPSLALLDFVTGDKLCMWLWVNVTTAGTSTTGTISVVEDTGGTAGVTGEAQAATPGYAPTPVALSATLSGAGTLAVTPVYVVLVAQDTFTRANNPSSWGTASNGQTWTTAIGSPTLSIASNEGRVTGTASSSMMQLTSTGSADVEGLVRMNFTTNATGVIALRFTDSGNYYRCQASSLSLIFQKSVSGSFANLPFISTSIGAATWCWLRFRVQGSTLSARVWVDGNTEPTSWALTTSDTGLPSGAGYGLHTEATAVGDITQFDSFTVSSSVPFSLATALSATMSGAGTLTPTLSLSTALSASLTGTGTLTPTLSASLALPGVTLAGTGTLSATMAATAPFTATMTGTGQLSVSSPTLSTALSGTVSGTGTLAATFSLATALVDTIAGVGTLTATPTFATALAATMTGAGTLAATLSTGNGGVALSVECDGVGTLTATLSLSTALACEMDGVGTLSGTLSLSTILAATLSGIGTLTPTLSASLALPGVTLAGSGQLSAMLSATVPLAITLTGSSQFSVSSPSLSTALSGTMTGAGTLSGALLASLALPAVTLAGGGTCSGTLTYAVVLSVQLAGMGTLTVGSPTLATALSGTCAGRGTLAATLMLILYALERAATWRTRDLVGTWQTRDLVGTWRTRDSAATWETRDQKASWETRDLKTTWKED